MSWFYLSLGSVFALALAELSQQQLLNTKKPFTPRTSAVITFVIQAILTIPLIAIFGYGKYFFEIFEPTIFLQLITVTSLASIATVFYLKSFRVKNISLSTIFISISMVVSTILGIIFFKESLTVHKMIGISLIMCAIILLNYKNSNLEKNHIFALLAGTLFGFAFTLDKNIVQTIHPINYMFWTFTLTSLITFLTKPNEVTQNLVTKNINAFGVIFLSSIGYFIYNFLTFTAYTLGGEVGKVDSINNTQVFIIIIFEYFVLKNTKGTLRKILSALVAFTGVAILGLGN